MDKKEWLVWLAALGLCVWGCWSALTDMSEEGVSPGRSVGLLRGEERGLSAEAEPIRWESDNQFSRFYRARGVGRDNSAVADFRDANGERERKYSAMESSLAALAASLDPVEVAKALAEAERSGASPEALAHYRYLKEIVDAFLQGRLHELVRRAESGA